ncbi:endolytic transglycosylase MltG [Ureibacillus thermophilus]|uniref:Endolytic murein transglycosylase n=1 Tax=Ureibacillus thermophilus TaxID=367743 RepID=A0A4P6UT69_9BACL|nr:endolytic transglycosylase MltG [Ureibacillus thermophilus]QBK26314.1 endolytic transglycosylase MltG [Ureibacillus thermophilus]
MIGGTYVDQEMMDKIKQFKQEGKVVRRIVAWVTIIVIALVLFIGIFGAIYVKSALQPVDSDSDQQIEVEIPLGSGITAISKILEEHGIIKDARIFKYYAKFKNQSNFQAGNYTMTPSMTLDEILESLKTGKVYREPLMAITIPEGLTLEQIGKIVEKHTKYTKEQFMDRVNSKEFIDYVMSTYPELVTDEILNENIRYPLEGYLFPATYAFYEENVSLDDVILPMIEKTNSVINEYKSLLAEREMSVHELLTIASLLEEEATAKTDRETIASVFYNRMEIGMPLQTDPSVLYALGGHKERVLYEDLEVQSPYNTYINPGLPPGPIANAGVVSIEAALNPTDTEYLYFLADQDGNNHFAKTYEEHLQNKNLYINNKK